MSIPLCLLAFSVLVEASPQRQSRWWFNIRNSSYVDQMVEIVKTHRSSITGVYMYCGLHMDSSGNALYDTFDGLRLETCVSPIINLGATAGVSLNANQDAIESGAALNGVIDLVGAAKKHRLTSIMVDYEPKTNINHQHAKAYANFITKLSIAMHAEGMETGICVSSWSILTEFGLYASTGVDSMMSMASTYFGRDVSTNKQWVTQTLEAGASFTQTSVGIGTMQTQGYEDEAQWDYKWSSSKLQGFISWLEAQGIVNIDVWRSDIGSLTGQPEKYYYDYIAAFLQEPSRCVERQPPSSWSNPTCESQLKNTDNCKARRDGTNTDGYCYKTCGVCNATSLVV